MTDIAELELIEFIVESSPAIIFRWVIQEGWPVEFVSKNIAQLGYTQDEMLSGKVSWPGITHPDDEPRLQQEVQAKLAKGVETWSQMYRIRAADGVYHWMRDWNILLRDAHKVPRKIQGIIIDITPEKVEEQQRQAAQLELEQVLSKVISGFVPICAKCKSIRDDDGKWIPIETFISAKSQAQFSHGLCPACLERFKKNLDA